VVRRRLGSELRRLRERAGLSLQQAAGASEISASKLSRLETGNSTAKLGDVRNLMNLYGVDDEGYRRRAERWVNEARSLGWWHPYSDAVFTDLDQYISLEAESATILHFSSPFIHGLLQVESYARAFLRAVLPSIASDEIERLVEVRMRRQEVLTRATGRPELHMVVDEAVLLRTVGDASVMAEQFDHLAEVARSSDIRVRPLDASPHIAILSPFTIFVPRESDIDPTVVNVESGYHDAYWYEAAEVRRFTQAFDELAASALSPSESAAMILAAASQQHQAVTRQ
jgi:transcriptional regulator with XRE-family HTH domain